MKFRAVITASAISVGALAISLLGASTAHAVTNEAVVTPNTSCGLHIIKQSYTNCNSYRDEVVIGYQMQGPGGNWIYQSINYCVGAHSTKNVAQAPGLLATQGTDLHRKC